MIERIEQLRAQAREQIAAAGDSASSSACASRGSEGAPSCRCCCAP